MLHLRMPQSLESSVFIVPVIPTRASSKEHGGAEGNTRSEIDILVRNYQKTKLPPRVDFPVKSEPTTLKTR